MNKLFGKGTKQNKIGIELNYTSSNSNQSSATYPQGPNQRKVMLDSEYS